MYCDKSNSFLKVTHFVFERGKSPVKYMENKVSGMKTRTVPVTYGQVIRDLRWRDSKNMQLQ